MKKLILFSMLFFAYFLSEAQFTFKDGGGTVDVYTNGTLKTSFQKAGLTVTYAGDVMTLRQDTKRSFTYKLNEIDTPAYSTMDSVVSVISGWLSTYGGSSYWTKTDGHIYPKTITDSVGIGTTTPSSLFEVKDLFKSNDANKNLFLGSKAGHSATTGANNFFLGTNAGYYNTSGSNNVFQGNNAGYYNTSGSSNIFQGYAAGFKNVSGSNNIFQGLYAGNKNIVGSNNIFLGFYTGYLNTSGSNNVYIGYKSAYTNITGTGNVFLGYQAGYNETGSNKLYIANSNTSTPLIYGEFDNKYLILNDDSISYRKGVAKFHRIDSLNTSSANTWITVKMDTMVGDESTYGFKFNSDSSAIICTQAGIIQVGGCVHYYFYGGSTTLAKLYTRVLIDGQEARCLQTNTDKNRFANATGYQNYIGSVIANEGSTIKLQIQVDNTDLDLQGAAVFDHPVAATIWFNYLSR